MAGTTLRDVARGYNREAVAGVLGAPVDMATTLANLLIAGGGYAAHKAGLINQPPELIGNDRSVGSSDWIYDRLPHQPALSGSRAETAGRLAGALMSPPAALAAAPTTIRAVARALQEKAPDVIDNYVRAIGGRNELIAFGKKPNNSAAYGISDVEQTPYGRGVVLSERENSGRALRQKVEVQDGILSRMIDSSKPMSEQSAIVRALAVPQRYREAYKAGLRIAKSGVKLDDLPMNELSKIGTYGNEESAFFEAGRRMKPPPVIADGVRYGEAPSTVSYNHADNVPELGVSMSSVSDGRFDDSWHNTISSLFIKNRPTYEYQGFVLPPGMRGSDGEPLMVGLKQKETGEDFLSRLSSLYGPEKLDAELSRRGILGSIFDSNGSKGMVVYPNKLDSISILDPSGMPLRSQ